MFNKILFVLLFSFCLAKANAQYNSIVAKDGSGNYSTVQAAIDNAPTNNTTPYVIYIAKGRYYEKVNIPSNKPNIQLIGESVSSVVIFYDDYAGKPISGGGTLGTQNSASFAINAADFVAMNITFENSFKFDSAAAAGVTGTQAVAVLVNADRSAFKNCRFIGMQDTLYTKGSGTPRHYFYKCYIDGIVDFIFGSSVAIFDSTIVYAKSRTTAGNSYITAANTTTGQAYGYWFKDCKIPPNTGNTLYFLGRPWNNATAGVTAANKTVYTNCTMGSSINPLGWSTWDAGTNTSVITYAEYKSKKFDGSLVDVNNRVAWSKQFTNTDTVGYNILNVFNGWNPCNVRADFCNAITTELAVSNFKSVKNGTNSNLSWNASFLVSGVTYNLYKSTDNKQTFQLIYNTTSTSDSLINFANVDAYPPNCSKYFYVVEAVKAGYTTTKTDTIEVSNLPVLNFPTNSIAGLLQDNTGPGVSQSFSFSASNLTSNAIVKAPANFEISLDNATWVNSSSNLTITPTGGNIAATTIFIRLNGTLPGAYTGNLNITTNCNTTAFTKDIALSGTFQTTTIVYYNAIQQWDLVADNTDNPAVRIPELTATKPVFSKFSLSNQTTVAPQAYTALYGQAFAATPNGSWSSGVGGNGGNLNRTFYEEFTIKPAATQQARIDSIVVNSAFYGSTSNTKFAAVWSKSNFTTDSANVTGGRDLTGLTLAAGANGGFTTPILLLNQNTSAGVTAQYGLALNAGNGVQLNGGDSLKIRLYYSCGSTSTGRYAMLKNVQIKGTTPRILPLKINDYAVALLDDKTVEHKFNTANEINVAQLNIEKSIDGKEFKTISSLSAKNKAENFYSFKEPKITNEKQETWSYRIVAIDIDGKKTYSEIKTLKTKPSSFNLNIYPNPSKGNITIESKDIKEILVIDAIGKVIKKEIFNKQNSLLNIQLNTGVYFVKALNKSGEMKVEKIIVE